MLFKPFGNFKCRGDSKNVHFSQKQIGEVHLSFLLIYKPFNTYLFTISQNFQKKESLLYI